MVDDCYCIVTRYPMCDYIFLEYAMQNHYHYPNHLYGGHAKTLFG